jgi:hypothetical protein
MNAPRTNDRKPLDLYDRLTAAAEAYFPLLGEYAVSCYDATEVAAVKKAISEAGRWQSSEEWRICTTWDSTIEPVPLPEKPGATGYRVDVECDYRFSCICQTVERAVTFLHAYQRLIMDLFYRSHLGWPGWYAPGQLEGPA